LGKKYQIISYISWEYRRSDGTEVAPNQQANVHFFCGKRNESHVIDAGSFVRKRIMSAVMTPAFVSDTMSYIILRGRWCDIIVLNVHAPTKDKINDLKDSY
jgi:hypothetical protein